jgi:ribose-phosphate pyrophosphokinase
MYFIPTSAAEHLVRGLQGRKGIEVILPGKNKDDKRYFPDGEVYTRIKTVGALRDGAVVFHSGQPDPNAGIIELEMILEALRSAGTPWLEVFFGYFPYCMQDKVFRPGEVNAAEALLKKLGTYYGVAKVYAIDPHFGHDRWLQQYSFEGFSAVPLLKAAALRDEPEILFVAPDSGGQARSNLAGLSKTRINSHNIEHHHDNDFAALVRGRHLGVVDDLVETGGTMVRFADKCREYGASSVSALITHGVMPSGIGRLRAAYDRFYLANTIDRLEANVDVSQLIAGISAPEGALEEYVPLTA